MRRVGSIPWSAVFDSWVSSEQGIWDEYCAARGYKSVRTWRAERYADPLELPRRRWTLYEVLPTEVLEWKCASHGPWVRAASIAGGRRIRDLAGLSEFFTYRGTEKIAALEKSYPSLVCFVGVKKPRDGVILIDGHHRAIALARLILGGRPPATTLTLAATDLGIGRFPHVDYPVEYGSASSDR